MADGAQSFPLVHEDGVFLDLPLSDYLADRALSSSGLKQLLVNAPDWPWEHPSNPLWRESESAARNLGSMVHKATLEGLDAYEATYCLAPSKDDHARALDTVSDLKEWLGERGLKVSGVKAELIERAQKHGADFPDDRPLIWDDFVAHVTAGRTLIKPEDDKYTRLVERFLRSDPAINPLISDGLAEISIFWTEDGIRYKSRIDYLTAGALVDLKKFGQPPKRGRSLMQHVLGEAINYSYDIQAVHNSRAVRQVPGLLKRCGVVASGHDASARIAALQLMANGWFAGETDWPTFHWIFIRCPGAPCAIAPIFRPSDGQWSAAEGMRSLAIENFKRFSATCGDGLWLRSEGRVEIDDGDWPVYAGDIGA